METGRWYLPQERVRSVTSTSPRPKESKPITTREHFISIRSLNGFVRDTSEERAVHEGRAWHEIAGYAARSSPIVRVLPQKLEHKNS